MVVVEPVVGGAARMRGALELVLDRLAVLGLDRRGVRECGRECGEGLGREAVPEEGDVTVGVDTEGIGCAWAGVLCGGGGIARCLVCFRCARVKLLE